MAFSKRDTRLRRKVHIRRRVKGTPERPRLTVSRSNRHIGAQVIDDENNKVLVAVTTNSKANQADLGELKKVDKAKAMGTKVAGLCKEHGVAKVVFDRNGFRYHGRVKALADAAREAGLEF